MRSEVPSGSPVKPCVAPLPPGPAFLVKNQDSCSSGMIREGAWLSRGGEDQGFFFFLLWQEGVTEKRRQAHRAREKATGTALASWCSHSSEPGPGVCRGQAYLLPPAQGSLGLVHRLRPSESTVPPCGSVILHCLALLPAVISQPGAGLVGVPAP